MKTETSNDHVHEMDIIILEDGDVLEIRKPKNYNLEDVILEWRQGKPEFTDEEDWLGYSVDTPYIKEAYFDELIRLPLHKAIANVDDLLEKHASSRLFNIALAEDLSLYKSNLTVKYLSSISFPRIDVLCLHIIQSSRETRKTKIRWSGPFAHFCEVVDALYTVELHNAQISKMDFFRLMKSIFEFDSEKSDENFRTTVSQIIRRNKPTKYLTNLILKYEFMLMKKAQEDYLFDISSSK